MLIEGTCTHGGGFLRRACGAQPVGQCVYCGQPFCDRHGDLWPEFHEVCARPACQAKYADVQQHRTWIEEHRGFNRVSVCAEDECQERMQHSCQRCQLRFCDEHLHVRQVMERRESPPREVSLLLCAHCTVRRRIWD